MPPGLLSIVLLLSFQSNASQEEFPESLNKWHEFEAPEIGSQEWEDANADSHEWMLTRGEKDVSAKLRKGDVNDKVKIPFKIKPGLSSEGLAGRRTVVEVENGWLVGFNAGEFGGAVWSFSANGSNRTKISDLILTNLIQTKTGVYGVDTIPQLDGTRGRIIKFTRGANDKWRTEVVLRLTDFPETATKDANDSLLVASSSQLLRIDPATKKLEVLVKHAFWGGLDPHSIILDEKGTIYVGMRKGVAKIVKKENKYETTWLLPNKNFANK